MKDITYDLIEKLREKENEKDPAGAVLAEASEGEYYYALSEERADLLDSLPFDREKEALIIGAGKGVFAPLSERLKSLTFADSEDKELEVIKYRFPKLLAENGGNIVLKKFPENLYYGRDKEKLPSDKKYDIVIAAILGESIPAAFKSFEEIASFAFSLLKEDGFFVLSADNADAFRFSSGCRKFDNDSYITTDEIDKIRAEHSEYTLTEYYPLPDAAFARNIYSEKFMPKPGDFKNAAESYVFDRVSSCDEEAVYGAFINKGIFRQFAPSFLAVFHKPENAEKFPVYSRFNFRRDKSLRIKTDIFERDGRKYARKTALSKEACAHIESFQKKREILEKSFGDTLQVLKPNINKDEVRSFAEFDFIKGKTFDSILSEGISYGKADIKLINEGLSLLYGKEEKPYDLDALFENVIVNESGRYLIDYEWTYEDGIDKDFLKYRILSYFYSAHKNELYAYGSSAAFLKEFGIEGESLSTLEEKEALFQSKVSGDYDKELDEKFIKRAKTPEMLRSESERLKEFTEWNLRLQDEIEEHKTVLRKEREIERLSQNHIRNIEKINADQKIIIGNMSSELEYLRRHQSIFSRIRNAFIRRLDAWAPQNSRKRKLIKYTKNTILHPAKYIKMYFTKEGREFIAGDFSIGGEFSEGGILSVPQCENPVVSIIIPVYNQVSFTYACIRSVIENTDSEKTPYEIILADDVSKDSTKEIDRFIKGLVIRRNSVNTGFLKNCNQGAEAARGKYIFFLNNDTKVKESWLESLVSLMENDESVGMAGSKLIYPDGRLQEAGGIIWSDASGWNYGRLDDPDKPEYNYVKDTDYISGAAIMIRHDLWNEIGGFDERFAPAYCEDSDLAFEVRKHGKRVVFQPLSVIVHFEGVSNGTDVTGTGLKKYQLVNQEKFREKWALELKKQEENTGNPDPFTARDRSKNKKCIVVIDHYVPTFDKDAGSKTTYQYIKMFINRGYNVKLVGDNFLHEEPYSTAFMQMGVEILYGPWYQNNIYDWFTEHKEKIDFVYLNRPHIAVKYIDFLKKNTDIKCIFYGHDLHYLRIGREYELSGEIRKKREADYWKGIEFSVMEKADMVYYPSEVETEAIARIHPEIRTKAITAYAFDEFSENTLSAEDYEKREGLLFVGGFSHPPNEDGVKWFIEDVFDDIKKAVPGITFNIAGSHASEELKALCDKKEGVKLLGFVSDEKLEELYRKTRLVIVPLRYGAGVKGKVVEAIYNQNAVVTTPVGAEGIPEAKKAMIVAEEKDFAKAVINCFNDTKSLAELSKSASCIAEKYFSTDAAWKVIEEDFC